MWGKLYFHVVPLIFCNIYYVLCQENGSLTFVIDISGSMEDDINQVRKSALREIDHKLSLIKNLVLITFNDAGAKVVVDTEDREVLKKHLFRVKLQNVSTGKIWKNGMWHHYDDCPERSMNAVIVGLRNSLPGSYIYVFTDALAKDYKRSVEIKRLCQKKQSQVFFILTGRCETYRSDKSFHVYYDIAAACTGLAIDVDKSEVQKVLDTLTGTNTEITTVLKSVTVPMYIITAIPFEIDNETEYAIVTASGDNVQLEVRQDGIPSVAKQIIDLWFSSIKVIKLYNLVPGEYKAVVRGTSEVSVYIVAKTDFIFSHGFSKLEPKNINDTTKQPINGAKTHLSVLIHDPKHTVNIVSAQIMDMNEKVLKTFHLKRVNGDFYTTEPFIAPSNRFKVAVIGYAKTDRREIKRIAKIPVTPQDPPIVLPDPKIPVVTISEGSQIEVAYGQTVRLTCKVSAYPEPRITWRNSYVAELKSQSAVVELPYEYISYLTISNISVSDIFTCNAKNAKNLSKSKNIRVIVKDPFVIKSAIQGSTEFKYGEKSILTCDIRGSVPISILWRFKDGKGESTSITTSDKYIVSADGTQLIINKMELDLVGEYSCSAYVLNNPDKKVKFIKRVEVGGLEIPKISGEPKKTVKVGDDVKIKCNIDGVPKPDITWHFIAKGVSKYTKISNKKSNENVLVISNVGVEHSGHYKCVAHNIVGETDHITELIVQVPPVITSKTTVFNVVEGRDKVLRIPCQATGDPKPDISWETRGATIKPNSKYAIEDGALIIKNPTVIDGVTYKCSAKNKAGSINKTFDVKVFQKPKVSGLSELIVKSGEAVEIKCNITKGVPEPKITWEFEADKSLMLLRESGKVISIPNVNRTFAGRYKCIAKNSVGSDHHTINLRVEFAPIIKRSPETFKAVNGDVALKIPCNVIGFPQPEITWKLNDVILSQDANYSMVNGALIIKDPKNKNQNGETLYQNYTCEAKNYLGSDAAKFAVEIHSSLDDYGTSSIVNFLEHTSPKLECLPADPKQSIRWFLQGEELNIPTKYLQLHNLDFAKEGNYSCRVSDMNGAHTHTYEVIVGYPPTYDQEGDPIFDWSGNKHDNLDCEVSARPRADIVWTYNGKVIKGQESYQLVLSGNWGKYACNVSNIYGTVHRTFEVTSSRCLMPRIPNDLKAAAKMPLILTTEQKWPVLNSVEDFLTIKHGEIISLSCPHQEVKRNYFQKLPTLDKITVACEKEDIFIVQGKPYHVSDLQCTEDVNAVAIKDEGNCLTQSSELIRVGYDVNGFLETYRVCFDTSKNMPLYTRVIVSKSNMGRGLTYSWDKHPSIDYSTDEGRYSCNSFNSTCCYGKTQLVNVREVMDGSPQRSTFIDPLNAIPYWHPCDGKDPWDALTRSITFSTISYDQLTVWSGTHDLQKMNGTVIPRYLWKVVKFDVSDEAVAIVYINDDSSTESNVLCKNICEKQNYDISYLNWLQIPDKNVYCCQLDEFLQAFGLSETNIGEL